MTRYLCLILVFAGCATSTLPRRDGRADSAPAATVQRVEVTSDEAAAIREHTTYAGAFMRYHAFVSEADTVEFWHDDRLLATIDDQGVIRYTPVILSDRGGSEPGSGRGPVRHVGNTPLPPSIDGRRQS